MTIPDLSRVTWKFAGPLSALPARDAWGELAGVAIICALFAWLSYRHTPRPVPWIARVILVGLRTLFLTGLLLCLANPVRVERTVVHPPSPPQAPPRRLAVVVDRSESMTRPDNRRISRLDDALAIWRRLEPAAKRAFASIRYFSLADDLRPAANLDQAMARAAGVNQTRLFQSVATLLAPRSKERPDAVVVLTDGVDTTDGSPTALRDRALAAAVPLYFVPGVNRPPAKPYFRVRHWQTPATVREKTKFELEADFEAFSRGDHTESFSVWRRNRRIGGGALLLPIGHALVPWRMPYTAGEPGTLDLTLRAGDTPAGRPLARSVTIVEKKQPINVLLYEGALDWGVRYLEQALRTDPNFHLWTVIYNLLGIPAPASGPAGSTVVGRLAGNAKVYAPFDCIVLADPYPIQLNAAQGTALVDFVRDGGSLLFVSPTREAVPQFVHGGSLSELLPVIFTPEDVGHPAVRGAVPPTMLTPFALTGAGMKSPIFALAGGGHLVPKFAGFVPVTRVKPGAVVLAVRPGSRGKTTGAPQILLATQTFGRGHTAILTCDSLWRWKLSVPSDSRMVAAFWQQLLLAIGRRAPKAHLRFVAAPVHARPGEIVRLELAGGKSAHPPSVSARAPDGSVRSLTVRPTGHGKGNFAATWTPLESGEWELMAAETNENRAYAFSSVATVPIGESALTPTAVSLMRSLAAATGGAVLSGEVPPGWRPPTAEAAPKPVVREQARMLWNRWMVLEVALGLFALELLLRRLWKLI